MKWKNIMPPPPKESGKIRLEEETVKWSNQCGKLSKYQKTGLSSALRE